MAKISNPSKSFRLSPSCLFVERRTALSKWEANPGRSSARPWPWTLKYSRECERSQWWSPDFSLTTTIKAHQYFNCHSELEIGYYFEASKNCHTKFFSKYYPHHHCQFVLNPLKCSFIFSQRRKWSPRLVQYLENWTERILTKTSRRRRKWFFSRTHWEKKFSASQLTRANLFAKIVTA